MKRSDGLSPRFAFLRLMSDPVRVAEALATGFEQGSTPLFRNTALIPSAIKELERDEAALRVLGDMKNAALIGKDIDRLKAKLPPQTRVRVVIPVHVKQYINDRLIAANIHRFQPPPPLSRIERLKRRIRGWFR